MAANQNANAARANQRIPVQEFAARFQSKKECYNFLTQQVQAYEPPQDTVTIWHLRDQINNTKSFLKCTELKHLAVPHYESLTLEKILGWVLERFPRVVERYFPIKRELLKFPRQVSHLSIAHAFQS